MRKMTELVKFQLQIYFRGNKFVMPLALTSVFIYMIYSTMPVTVVDSILVSCYFAFLTMVWIGFSTSSDENPVMEQIQLLRIQSRWLYYMSKMVFLVTIGGLVSCICTFFPVVQNLLNGGNLFTRQLTGYDVLNGLILLIGYSFVGGAMGSLLHPRVMKDRKTAVALTALLTLLSLTRKAWMKNTPLRVLAWCFPPVDKVAEVYRDVDSFRLTQTVIIFSILVIYGIVLGIAKSIICEKKKF